MKNTAEMEHRREKGNTNHRVSQRRWCVADGLNYNMQISESLETTIYSQEDTGEKISQASARWPSSSAGRKAAVRTLTCPACSHSSAQHGASVTWACCDLPLPCNLRQKQTAHNTSVSDTLLRGNQASACWLTLQFHRCWLPKFGDLKLVLSGLALTTSHLELPALAHFSGWSHHPL